MENKTITPTLLLSIVATGLLSFSGVVIETAMNITFPHLMKVFGASLSSIQWLTTSYLLVLSIMIPLSAYFKQRFETKKLFIIAASFFLGGLLVDALAPNLPILIIGRVLQGVGTGISLPMMFNIILEQAPRHQQGLLIGAGNFITATAPAIGPTFGGMLVDSSLGWRSIFWVIIPVVAIALIIGVVSIQQYSEIKYIKLDITGWLNLSLLFSFLILALTQLGQQTRWVLIFGCLALIFLVLTIFWYKKVDSPIIKLSLFKNSWFSGHLIAFILCQFEVMGLAFLLPNLVQILLGKTSFVAGLTMLPGAVLGAVLAPIGGNLLDKYGAVKPIIAGISLETIGVIIFLSVFQNSSVIMLAGVYMIFTLGQGISVPNILTSGLSKMNLKDKADGNAIFNTLQQFAGAAGTSIISIIIATDHTSHQLYGFNHGLVTLTIGLLIDLGVLVTVFAVNNVRA